MKALVHAAGLVARKDLTRLWPVFLSWAVFLVSRPLVGGRFHEEAFGWMLLVVVLFVAIEDANTTEAWWRTRPLSGLTLLAGKLGLLVVLVLAPVLIWQFRDLCAFGVGNPLEALPFSAARLWCSVLTGFAIASVAHRLVPLVLVVAVAEHVLLPLTSQADVILQEWTGRPGSATVGFLALSSATAFVAWLWSAQRGRGRILSWLALTLVLALVQSGHVRTQAMPERKAEPLALSSDITFSWSSSEWEAWIVSAEPSLTPELDSIYADVHSLEGVLTFADGTRYDAGTRIDRSVVPAALHLLGFGGEPSTTESELIFVFDDADLRERLHFPGSFRCDIDMTLWRPHILAKLPLREGALFDHSGVRFQLTSIALVAGDIDIEGTVSQYACSNCLSPWKSLEFALQAPELGEIALPPLLGVSSTDDQPLLNAPLNKRHVQEMSFSRMPCQNFEGDDSHWQTFDEAWLEAAELVVIEKVLLERVTRTLHEKDVRIADWLEAMEKEPWSVRRPPCEPELVEGIDG